jgi:two-component system chemotaxis sensor kinase CheA
VKPEGAANGPDHGGPSRAHERPGAFNLIFLPGFSTAEKITNVSGPRRRHGCGEDEHREDRRLGGRAERAQFRPGTTIKIKIPLTLAIIPALIVTRGGERFAIPQVSLAGARAPRSGAGAKEHRELYGAPVYRLRGKLLPLVYLNRS